MTADLQFTWDWLPPFGEPSPEASTFAELKLRLGERYATELEDIQARSLREGMFVSAYPLALFLALNWWRLRWEPAPLVPGPDWRLRHNIAAAGEGYAWPDITIAGDGEVIFCAVKPSVQSGTSPVRYVANFTHRVGAETFERAVRDFVEGVLARLRAMAVSETELESVWGDVCAELADPQASRWRRLEALAGYDPDQSPDGFIDSLLGAGAETGWGTIQELAAASRERALDDLRVLRGAVSACGVSLAVEGFDLLQQAVRSALFVAGSAPWRKGAEAAQKVRHAWGVDGRPLENKQLAQLLNLPGEVLEPGAGLGSSFTAPYSVWMRDNNNDHEARLVLNRRPASSRRFAVCRLLGDRLLAAESGDRLYAATDAGSWRQKFQRSFAQELLCPFVSLMDFLSPGTFPNDDAIEDAACHFQVSPRLVHTTLVNNHVLPSETLEEKDWAA
ncbi:hypothetical protein ACHHRT_12945 [Desulfurivibrio sp. D14AmB]|uniref:hypothetical protein n=1 Tax=Desulfurivibrio sp. D14AmB TaxID=3374370 RepID=UPI00376ED042